jgi:ketosteroid isomerase-like protein
MIDPRRMRVMLGRLAALALIACVVSMPSVVVAQGRDASTTPEAVVRELLDAMSANDAARIRAVFAPSARQAYGDSPPKTGEAFSAWLKSDIIDRHGQVSSPRLAVGEGGVVVTGQYRNNAGYSSAANFLIKVEGGKIVSWQMRY